MAWRTLQRRWPDGAESALRQAVDAARCPPISAGRPRFDEILMQHDEQDRSRLERAADTMSEGAAEATAQIFEKETDEQWAK